VRGEIKHIRKALSRGTPRSHSRLTSTSSGVLSSICFDSSVGTNMVDRRAFNATSVASAVSEISCSSELRVEVCEKMVAEREMTRGACRGVDGGVSGVDSFKDVASRAAPLSVSCNASVAAKEVAAVVAEAAGPPEIST